VKLDRDAKSPTSPKSIQAFGEAGMPKEAAVLALFSSAPGAPKRMDVPIAVLFALPTLSTVVAVANDSPSLQ
jgi:hypothetical protein